jgi:arabinofuranosyltransferase
VKRDTNTGRTLWATPFAVDARVAVGFVIAIVVFAGWRTMWFLTDDAYIEFRYVANAMAGYGFVWNPPPFHPVEGYTSFLWACVLKLVWQLTGVEPPECANALSLAFGYGTLGFVYAFVARMELPRAMRRHRLALLTLVLFGTATNRTFLTWLSSGLETALFNLCFVGWIYEGLTPPSRRGRLWVARLATAAALTALTRPDGLLAVAATLALVVFERLQGTLTWKQLGGLAPLSLIPAHATWRFFTYGDWLPNTYYAKHVRPWPESGARYIACFILEYGVYVWLVMALAWLVVAIRATITRRARPLDHAHVALTVWVVLGHVAYYTFVIGGDHFEYRVYSYLVPLLYVSAAWLGVRIFRRPAFVSAALMAFVLASYPVAWAHWSETHDLDTRRQTHMMKRPIAGFFPAAVRPVIEEWDAMQAWLITHHVGMRHQEHKVFWQWSVSTLPTREEGSRIGWEGRPVLPWNTVGVLGWVLPHVAVIDEFGLNDRVIAHAPPISTSNANRLMAHDRHPPAGYLACFRPNVRLAGRRARVTPRPEPLTDDEIRACESRAWR